MAKKAKRMAGWVVSGLLAALFLMAGVTKLLGAPQHVQHFAGWGYPDWFRHVLGSVETAFALLLLVPRTTALGAGGIATIMLGATHTHLFRAEDEASRARFTVTLLALAGAAALLRARR